ncbi:MAG: ribosome-recycling factor [Microcystis wesenbergii TW10]|uniref:Ribosome-recycling factor n=1 Tax=Microcystis wesenbergii TW10 TaxID=2060474 RepID=A0A3E0LXN5_9CHRO|nr:MAG: ribosome-recycling factor [Microcystis wesenbergii TW10]TRU55711.1 MAG: ribosome-recycling factor [Microcystis aeruginosa Ma_QC_C_20070823_S13D]TRU57390.1 MAG: ribosome-recycling factor [Microcystis aeruginosa Ma_QC_C_20070823_S13]
MTHEKSPLFLDFPRINILAMAKSLTEPEFKQYNTNELLDTKS